MKAFSIIASVLLATSAIVDGRVGLGGCPTLTSVPFDAAMAGSNDVYAHYVDILVQNGYSLYELLIAHTYGTFDCQRLKGGIKTIYSSFDATAYNSTIVDYLENPAYPFRGAVSYFDNTTKTYIFQGCIDITYLSGALTSIVAGGGIPSWAMTLISIGTFVLKFTHFTATLVASEQQNILTTDAIYSTLNSTLLSGPDNVNMGWLAELNVSQARCASVFV